MAKIKSLKDNQGEVFYPVTHMDGIFSSNGNSLIEELISGGFLRKIARIQNTVVIAEAQNEVAIGIEDFNKDEDLLMVFKNSTFMTEGIDYIVSENNTIINLEDSFWNTNNEANYTFTFVVMRHMPVLNKDQYVNADLLQDGAITLNKLDPEIIEVIANAGQKENLENLQTENKSSLVVAINEINSKLGDSLATCVQLLNDMTDLL